MTTWQIVDCSMRRISFKNSIWRAGDSADSGSSKMKMPCRWQRSSKKRMKPSPCECERKSAVGLPTSSRYLDEAAIGTPGPPPPDFLSHSHGEGFLRFFEERCQRQGIFIFDEPESALSPARQMEFLKLMRRMEESTICQIVMATHSPMLMAYPNARLLRLSKYGLEPVTVEETDHYKVMREFCADPSGFVEAVIEE